MSKASLAASVLKFIPLASFRWNTTIWLADTTIHTGIAVDEVFYLCFHTFHTILSLIKHVQTNSANYGHTLISYKHVKLWGTYQFHSVLVIRHQDHQHFFYLFGTACVTHDYITPFLIHNASDRSISGWIIQHTSIFSVCWETHGEPDIFHSKSSKLSTNLGGEQASQTTIQEMRRRVSMVTRRPPSSTPGQSLVKPTIDSLLMG